VHRLASYLANLRVISHTRSPSHRISCRRDRPIWRHDRRRASESNDNDDRAGANRSRLAEFAAVNSCTAASMSLNVEFGTNGLTIR